MAVGLHTTQHASNRVVHQAKSEAEKVAFQKVDARSEDVYRLAKQMGRDNQDDMGEKPVKNDAGQLSLDEESKKEAWKEHYERLLNFEFPWIVGTQRTCQRKAHLKAQASQSPLR